MVTNRAQCKLVEALHQETYLKSTGVGLEIDSLHNTFLKMENSLSVGEKIWKPNHTKNLSQFPNCTYYGSHNFQIRLLLWLNYYDFMFCIENRVLGCVVEFKPSEFLRQWSRKQTIFGKEGVLIQNYFLYLWHIELDEHFMHKFAVLDVQLFLISYLQLSK